MKRFFPRQMGSRILVPALALGGFGFALFYVNVLSKPAEAKPQQIALPAESPFQHTVSASGLVEASSRNISLYPQVPGQVEEILVSIGQTVKAGDALFRIDDWQAAAQLTAAKARLKEATVQADDAADLLARARKQKAGVSISDETLARRRFAAEAAAARVQTAMAEVKSAEVLLEQHVVRAPVEGKILKINMAAGEFISLPAPGAGGLVPLILGNDTPLYVRASIDETDLWRLPKNARASGALRGNRDVTFMLKPIRTEPLVLPKRSLTGDTAERVDTRVLEVIYEIIQSSAPVYIGQQVDVFIGAADGNDTKSLRAPQQKMGG